ncbi:MAG: hypothetical protein QGG36_08180 [Pirellulaceae bacterium]|jgi:cytochrome c553|nr:hypothetical protein [Pirellulaceae bacterium]
MKKFLLVLLAAAFVAGSFVASVNARPAYKGIVDKMEAKTDAEKAVQKVVKEKKCNACHGKKKKMRLGVGVDIGKALGKEFKYVKAVFAKKDGKYSDEAVELLRVAINKTKEKK